MGFFSQGGEVFERYTPFWRADIETDLSDPCFSGPKASFTQNKQWVFTTLNKSSINNKNTDKNAKVSKTILLYQSNKLDKKRYRLKKYQCIIEK